MRKEKSTTEARRKALCTAGVEKDERRDDRDDKGRAAPPDAVFLGWEF